MSDIKILNEDKGEFVVDTRAIWESIGSRREYSHWIKYYIDKFNWVEGKHYIVKDFDMTKNVKSNTEPNSIIRGGDRKSKTYFITANAELTLKREVLPESEEKAELINKMDKFTINTRDLYKELGIETRYNDWIDRFIKEYNLDENIDYKVLLKKEYNLQGGRPLKDYYIRPAIKDLIISKHSKEADKNLTEFASKVAEIKDDPVKFVGYIYELMLKEQKEKRELEAKNKELETENKELDTRVELLESGDTPYYDMSDVCGEFGFKSAIALNKYFVSNGYLKRLNGEYYVKAEYTTQGWFTKKMRFIKNLGYNKSMVGLTPTGRIYFKRHFEKMK